MQKHVFGRAGLAVVVAWAVGGCEPTGRGDASFVDGDPFAESSAPLVPPDCTNADVCTAPTEGKSHCYTASSDATSRREVAQSFNPTRTGPVNFVRLNVKRLLADGATTAVLRVDLRALEAQKVPVDAARTIASGTVAISSLFALDQEVTVPLSPAVDLAPSPDGSASYAIVLRVDAGTGAVGVACAADGDVYDAGTAWRRDRLRVSGTSFTNPPFADAGRDLSFAFSLGCDSPYGDCDGLGSNACETDLLSTLSHCGACGVSCDAVAGSTATTCTAGACRVSSCTGGRFDLDGTYANGCECVDGGGASACASAADLGSFTAGTTGTRDGVVPLDSMSDWYAVTFPLNASFQQKGTGTPTIALEQNPNDAYRIEVRLSGCVGAPFVGAVAPPYTSVSFADTYTYAGGNFGGGAANPCVGSQCAATAVSTTCAYTSGAACAHGSSTYCAVVSASTCGCNYQTVRSAYSADAGLVSNFTTAGQAGCPFTNGGQGGVGTYGRRSQSWPSSVLVRVYRKPGSTSGCETYRLRVSR